MKNRLWGFLMGFILNMIGLGLVYSLTTSKKIRLEAWRGFWIGTIVGTMILLLIG